MANSKLTLLFDGSCPFCTREVAFLRLKDKNNKLKFIDIDSREYNPDEFSGITYKEAMTRIHGIKSDGKVLRDLDVFREAYKLVGLSWVYEPTKWPLFRQFAQICYWQWARWRLLLTNRPPLEELCKFRENIFNN
ncbi:thiol-disulfide oxidoreductase DCC family protein [Prochlorococcus marinus]|uniref:Uncharacterized protein conserved in bacteria n=1 Tax=Prochlorococcus marinus (strain MIT 9211) TaxID=93059 RepID=A9BBA8_PROM4|nr:DUF393 domain-containing protein [Prochlorococcus marinus]ABX09120.1 Uncharacterized protein conserved in bacteria [Prochlorococcus marinus str. MIT 9211]